jgi:hypothetical protein
MKRIGLLLGAGASFESGMPLVWDLSAEIRAWLTPEKLRALNEGWRTQGGGNPQEVIDTLVTSLLDGSMHYENILGNLEAHFNRPANAPARPLASGLPRALFMARRIGLPPPLAPTCPERGVHNEIAAIS